MVHIFLAITAFGGNSKIKHGVNFSVVSFLGNQVNVNRELEGKFFALHERACFGG